MRIQSSRESSFKWWEETDGGRTRCQNPGYEHADGSPASVGARTKQTTDSVGWARERLAKWETFVSTENKTNKQKPIVLNKN